MLAQARGINGRPCLEIHWQVSDWWFHIIASPAKALRCRLINRLRRRRRRLAATGACTTPALIIALHPYFNENMFINISMSIMVYSCCSVVLCCHWTPGLWPKGWPLLPFVSIADSPGPVLRHSWTECVLNKPIDWLCPQHVPGLVLYISMVRVIKSCWMCLVDGINQLLGLQMLPIRCSTLKML